jgi:hypothetical protein
MTVMTNLPRPLILSLAIMGFSGCAQLEQLERRTAPDLTPATGWADAKARYSDSQHEAVLYARRCDNDHSMFLTSCNAVVRELSDHAELGKLVINDGDAALRKRDNQRLSEAISDLDAVAGEIDRTLERAEQ